MKSRTPGIVAVCAIAWSVVQIADAIAQQNIKSCREGSPLPSVLWPSRACLAVNFFDGGLAGFWKGRGLAGLGIMVPELFHWHLVWLAFFVVGIYAREEIAIALQRARWFVGPILALSVYWFGMRDFGGFDFSIIVDSAYRVMHGEVLYRDVYCSLAPGMFLPAAMAFSLLGIKWSSLCILNASFALVTFYWLWWLLDRLGVESPVFAALAIESCGVISISFWWYNPITSIMAAVFALSCWLRIRYDSIPVRMSLCLSMAALALTKPNTAAPMLLVGCVAVLWRDRTAILEMLGATGLACAVLLMAHIPIGSLIGDGLLISVSRAGNDPWIGWRINGITDTIRALLIVAMLLASILAQWKRIGHRMLAFGCVLTAAIAMTTNGEVKEVDTPLLIVASLIATTLPFSYTCTGTWQWQRLDYWARSLRMAAMSAAILCCFYMGESRYRVATIGEHRFHEWDQERQVEPLAFFQGFQGSPTLERTIQQAQLAARGSVFYGSRLEWMYAATGRPSPKGFPIWWDPASSFPKTLTEHFEHVWEDKHFDTLIFCRWDAPFYGPEFGEAILTDYSIDNRYSELTVFRRKKPQWTAGH